MTVGEVGSTNSPGLHRQAHRQADAGISRWCRAKFRWNFLNTKRPRMCNSSKACCSCSLRSRGQSVFGECQKLGELPNQTRDSEPYRTDTICADGAGAGCTILANLSLPRFGVAGLHALARSALPSCRLAVWRNRQTISRSPSRAYVVRVQAHGICSRPSGAARLRRTRGAFRDLRHQFLASRLVLNLGSTSGPLTMKWPLVSHN